MLDPLALVLDVLALVFNPPANEAPVFCDGPSLFALLLAPQVQY
jgi:hypothetical protein